ncbi:MAG TPA: type III pantothenate kinase [Alphaproteobacteria bacterium]|nr:type III pantothenate kinase [Alphaproteobacteria bacterium]
MLLAIDCGNTNTVFAVYDGEVARGEWRIATDGRRTADEYAVWLTQLMSLQDLRREYIDGAIIATVVPGALFALKTLCRRFFEADPLVVGEPNVKLGLKALVDNPQEVGADRLVNAVAGHARYPGDLILLDFGTATTFDVVSAKGDYLGGVIAPGINLSIEALHMAAAQLPRIGVKKPEKVIGKSTVPAMQSGVFWGYVGLIEGIVARITAEIGGKPTVVATGGLAPLFKDATPVIDHLDADMTVRGLVAIWRKNRPK